MLSIIMNIHSIANSSHIYLFANLESIPYHLVFEMLRSLCWRSCRGDTLLEI